MKKHIFLTILIVLTIVGLGFYNKNRSKEHLRYDDLEYTYSYYQGYYFEYNIIKKISNKQNIENILSKINNLSETLINKLNAYNEDYFINKDLIIVYLPIGSSTPTSRLDNLIVNDNIEVTINIQNYEYGTTDMSGHLYIIEISKSEKSLIVYSKVDDEKKLLNSPCEFSKTYKIKKVVNTDSKCQYVTLSSFTSEEEYEMPFCDTNYISFENGKMYKFTFTPYGIPNMEDSIKNMMIGNFIGTKIEETNEIVNEDICHVTNIYFP